MLMSAFDPKRTSPYSRMKKLLTIALAYLLAGCITSPPLSEGITLSVRSYDRVTGNYVIELRNGTARPILYLTPYLTFHTVRSPSPEPFPESPEGMALMVQNAKLAPGESIAFSGQCTIVGACSKPGTYVAIRACWFGESWTCKQYVPVWSRTPLNGA